jgi:pSer/pThr/pTyr-binding forkhead associated (FHA) protein
VGVIDRFFAKLKGLLEQSTAPSAESIEQPTADRPPPLADPALHPEPAPPDVATTDDVSEVRALLEAVAETPVAETPVAETPVARTEPDAPLPLAAQEPGPTSVPDLSPTSPPVADEEAVDVAGAATDPVGGALILTLATPAATFTIARSGATVGRGPENPIRLDDLSVSRRHARIAYRQGGYWLSDLGSMGGTWVNGTRLNAPRRIAAGEVIDIGHCRLTVGFASEPAEAEIKRNVSDRGSEVAGQARRRR